MITLLFMPSPPKSTKLVVVIVTESVVAYAGTLIAPPVGGVLSTVIATEESEVVAPAPFVALDDPSVLEADALPSV